MDTYHTISLSDEDDADPGWTVLDPQYQIPGTPTSSTGDEGARHQATDADSDEEDDARDRGELVPRTKPGGYDSRIEQMLYENPEIPILITEAGKSAENGRYIVYTIKTGVWNALTDMRSWPGHAWTDLDLRTS
jgi:hypothetical protein